MQINPTIQFLQPTKKAQKPSFLHTCILYNDDLYFFGGNHNTPKEPPSKASFQKIHCFHLRTRFWETITTVGTPPHDSYYGKFLYKNQVIVFGENEEQESRLFFFDLDSKKWKYAFSKLDSFFFKLIHPLVGAVWKDYLFIRLNDSIAQYDILSDKWNTELTYSGDRMLPISCQSAVLFEDNIYFYGGVLEEAKNQLFKFNCLTHEWKEIVLKTHGPTMFSHAATRDGHLMFLFGGVSRLQKQTLFCIDLYRLDWVDMKIDLDDRYGHSMVYWNGKLVVFGGKYSKNELCGNEILFITIKNGPDREFVSTSMKTLQSHKFVDPIVASCQQMKFLSQPARILQTSLKFPKFTRNYVTLRPFFSCNLWVSTHPKYEEHSIIDTSKNPFATSIEYNNSPMQQTDKLIFRKRPWVLCNLVYGFSSTTKALELEYYWQNPIKIKPLAQIIQQDMLRTEETKTKPFHFTPEEFMKVKPKVRILFELLALKNGPFSKLPLMVVFSKETKYKQWLERLECPKLPEQMIVFDADFSDPKLVENLLNIQKRIYEKKENEEFLKRVRQKKQKDL